MRRSNSLHRRRRGLHLRLLLLPGRLHARGQQNLVALGIHHARARLIPRLELDLALERLDLLRIEEVAVLVAVLDALLGVDQALAGGHDWGARDLGVGLLGDGLLRVGDGDLALLAAGDDGGLGGLLRGLGRGRGRGDGEVIIVLCRSLR